MQSPASLKHSRESISAELTPVMNSIDSLVDDKDVAKAIKMAVSDSAQRIHIQQAGLIDDANMANIRFLREVNSNTLDKARVISAGTGAFLSIASVLMFALSSQPEAQKALLTSATTILVANIVVEPFLKFFKKTS